MNFGEMRTLSRILLGETDSTNSYYDDTTEIDVLINLANKHVAGSVPTNLSFKGQATVSGTYRYPLPQPDFLQLKDVLLIVTSEVDTEPLARVTFDEFEEIAAGDYTSTGRPAYYRVEFGAVDVTAGSPPGDIWLTPTPDDNGGSDYTLRIYYFQIPTPMSADADVSELPLFLHEAVVYWASMNMAMKSDSRSKARELAAMYKETIFDAKKIVNKRDRTGNYAVRDTMGYGDIRTRARIPNRRIR